jgi:hypothetical protein
MSASPAGASAAVTINITGTGFDPTANNNEVSFVPASGATVTARGSSIVLVSASAGTRRLAVVVPAGLAVGRVSLRVRNTVTQETSEGQAIDLIAIQLPEVTSGTRGASNLAVRITGSGNTQFVQGVARATFGAGITVLSTTVQSPTSLVATISIAATAALGARTAGVITNGQTALVDGFQVTDATGPANRPPAFTSTPKTTASEARGYSYQATASDPDGDPLTFTLTTAPGGMTIGPTGLIAWTPAAAQTGPQPVTVRVADPAGAFATQAYTIAVTPNTPPTIGSTPPSSATEATGYRYDVGASDADGDPLTYVLLQGPAGMTIGPSGRIDWTPRADQVATQPVSVEVRDDRGGHATQTFSVTVAALNRAPRIDSAPVTTAREQLQYSYQVHATDPNGDPIAYALATAPTGMTISAATGLIAWTPPTGGPTPVHVVVATSDGAGGSDSQAFDIAVTPAPKTNQAPRITSTPTTTARTSEPYVYDVRAEDADAGDTVTFSLVQPPPGMTISAASGHIAWTPAATQVGPFAVTVAVSDGTDTAQQAFELTVAAAQPVNRSPSAHAGGPYHGDAGTPIAFDGAASSDPDGDTLTFSWNFGDGSTAAGSAPSHVYAEAGSFVVTLTVTDGHGGESARSTTAAIGTAGDRSPPSVTLLGPREVLPGDQVTLTAQAIDNVKVATVTFEIDGANPTETSTEPFQRSIVVPTVASPGTTILVKATAADPSGNTGSAEATLTIKARPDTDKPTIHLNAPPIAAPGTTIHLSASADDNSGIQSVGFSVNGASIVQLTEPPYEASYDIPADTPIGAALTAGAFALDFSANRTDTSATIGIVQTPDTQAPTVVLSAGTTIVPGATLSLSASAADNRGVLAVDFYVDGVKIASDTQAPYAAAFAVPGDAQTGRSLQLEARAIDFAGLQGTDSRQTLIISASSLAEGVITGQIYDDTTGLRVEGAAVALTGADISGQPYTQTATSDSRGRFSLRAVEGRGVVHITRAGWTRVDRQVDVTGNKSIDAFDARVTPLTPASDSISPVLGATVAGPAGSQATLLIPPGGLTSSAIVAVTPIGSQGLQGLLPAGWSPVAAADVTPHALSFAVPATLSLARADVPSGATLVLARWDEGTSEWRAVSQTGAGAAGTLTAAIDASGQYAWLLGDTAPAAPPSPIPGAALSGVVIAGPIPTDAATSVLPQSKIVFYQPGVRTPVTAAITPTAPLSSGSLIVTRVSESYRFSSGLEAHLDPYVEDLVLYQAGGPSTLGARYTVTPSITFEPVTLQSGIITVELFDPPAGPRVSDVVGDDGGSVTAVTGERVDVPANGLTTPAAVTVRGITADDLGFELPASLTFAGGLTVSASGAQFTGALTLSIPKPPQAPADSQILIARITDIGTTSRLVLVALGRLTGDRIESSTALGSNPVALEGPRVEGRYLFLRPASPVGFASGLVRAVNGDPFTGALVSADTLPLFALSRGGGEYVAAASVGAVSLLAQDLTRNDTGSAQGTIAAAGAVLPIDLRLSAQTPQVLTISPTDQAENVPLSNPIVVTFSEPLNPNTVTPASVVLAGPDGTPVSGTLALSGNNSVVTFRPASALPADTAFTVTVAATIADLSGYTLPQAVTSRFSSLDITAPPLPPAGTIAASIPANGTTTVTGTQGTAGPHDTVSILNQTRGTTTPVLLDPSGGFSAIVAAGLGDQLRLKIVDAAGNVTVVDLPLFTRTNADGSVSAAVGAAGGRVDGPGGVSASVKPGTFPDGAIVTIKPVAEAAFPVAITPEQKQVFPYAGGVELDFGGQVPTQYVNVSVPAAASDRPGDQWIVNLVSEVNGQKVLNVVDTAKLIDGKVTTSSPPCPGVNAAGVYGIFKSNRRLGLTFGSMAPTIEPLLLSAGTLDDPFISPFVVVADVIGTVFPKCLPVLSGRVTVVPNTVTIAIAKADINPAVTGITIKNDDRKTESSFGRASFEFPVTVRGDLFTRFKVVATVDTGSTSIPFKQIANANQGFVDIVLGSEALTLRPTEIVLQNLDNRVLDRPIADDELTLTLRVAGGANDHYRVFGDDPLIAGCCRISAADPQASADGEGNLLARAEAGTIDPTKEEIALHNATFPDEPPLTGPGRTKVEIIARNPDTHAQVAIVEVPAEKIVLGGFSFALDGDPANLMEVRVSYDNGSTNSIVVPMFRITVSNPITGTVLKTIILPSPPPNEPVNFGPVTDDNVPPRITSDLSGLSFFDPSSDLLTFTFSEPLNADRVKQYAAVVDSSGKPVPGEFRLSSLNTVLTFVPSGTLPLGATFTVQLNHVTDLGANPLPAGSQSLRVTTLAPRLVGSLDTTPGPAGIRDIQIRTKDAPGAPPQAGVPPSVMLVATTDTKLGNPLITIDVTSPERPTPAGKAQSGFIKQKLALLPDVGSFPLAGPNPCAPTGATFSGDLAVTTSWTVDFTYVTFFDVTNPAAPCRMSDKILTATPDSNLFEVTAHGTYHLFGVTVRGLATIPHAQGIASYAAISEAGLFAVDVGADIPEKPGTERVVEPMLPGDYFDVVASHSRLLALNRSGRQLEIIDPTLAVLAVLPLPDAPRRIVVSEGFPFDANGNGVLDAGETIDVAFIGGDKNIVMVDVTNALSPRIVGMVTMPAVILDFDVDRQRRQLVAVDNQSSICIVDLAKPSMAQFVDNNADGIDDRIAWRQPLKDAPAVVRLDTNRPYVYVGTARGLQVYALGLPNLKGQANFTYYPVDDQGVHYPPKGEKAGTRPIRGAIVELRRSTEEVLQTSTTDAAGFYSFDAPHEPNLHVVVKAQLGRPNDIHLDVIDNTNKNSLFFASSDPFTLGSANQTHDVLAETVWTYPPTPDDLGSYDKRDGAPFAILDTIYEAERVVRQTDPAIQFPMLHIGWSILNKPNHGPRNVNAGDLDGGAFYSSVDHTLYLSGLDNVDTDEFDAPLVLHEWSHYFQDSFGRLDGPGNAHDPGDKLDPRIAFNEGFATAHAAMLLGSHLYVDTSGANQRGVFTMDLEQDSSGNSGYFTEDAVQELLWDLYDPVSPDPESDEEQEAALPPDPPGTITLCLACVVQDNVELPYRPFYRAMRAQKTSRPFVTIFSYLKSLLADPDVTAADRTNIGVLAKAENIDLTSADEYEMTPHDLYTVIPVTGDDVLVPGGGPFIGAALKTRTVNDPKGKGNKLWEHVFFKFRIETEGAYEIDVVPLDGKVMRLTILAGVDPQTITLQSSAPGSDVQYPAKFAVGDYSVAVEGYSGFRPDLSGIPVDATFKIRIRSITPTGQ